MVPGAGVEPARGYPQGIFLPTTAFAAALKNTFVVWTLPLPTIQAKKLGYGLGRSRQVSTLSLKRLSSGLPLL